MLILVTGLVTAKASKLSHGNAMRDIVREGMIGSKNVPMARESDSVGSSMSLVDSIGLKSARVAHKIRVLTNLSDNNVMLALKESETTPDVRVLTALSGACNVPGPLQAEAERLAKIDAQAMKDSVELAKTNA